MDLQGVFVKIGDFIRFEGFLAEFLENRRSWENQTLQKITRNVDFSEPRLLQWTWFARTLLINLGHLYGNHCRTDNIARHGLFLSCGTNTYVQWVYFCHVALQAQHNMGQKQGGVWLTFLGARWVGMRFWLRLRLRKARLGRGEGSVALTAPPPPPEVRGQKAGGVSVARAPKDCLPTDQAALCFWCAFKEANHLSLPVSDLFVPPPTCVSPPSFLSCHARLASCLATCAQLHFLWWCSLVWAAPPPPYPHVRAPEWQCKT